MSVVEVVILVKAMCLTGDGTQKHISRHSAEHIYLITQLSLAYFTYLKNTHLVMCNNTDQTHTGIQHFHIQKNNKSVSKKCEVNTSITLTDREVNVEQQHKVSDQEWGVLHNVVKIFEVHMYQTVNL